MLFIKLFKKMEEFYPNNIGHRPIDQNYAEHCSLCGQLVLESVLETIVFVYFIVSN